jgi:hypothetical protein
MIFAIKPLFNLIYALPLVFLSDPECLRCFREQVDASVKAARLIDTPCDWWVSMDPSEDSVYPSMMKTLAESLE